MTTEQHQLVQFDHDLIIASNRAPVTFEMDDKNELQPQRGSGGLVTALTGMARQTKATWIACSMTEGDRAWGQGRMDLFSKEEPIEIKFLSPPADRYEGYYNVIANPLLWFLQHSMWDVPRSPIINRSTWRAWEEGYVAVNKLFAEAIAASVRNTSAKTLIMLQDYHLYLVAQFLRQFLGQRHRSSILHFIHIPWPGPEYWGFLPTKMRQSILEGLCSVDLLGFQTHEDGLNFIRTCESYLPGALVRYHRGAVRYHKRLTHVRDFPISIDVSALRIMARSHEVAEYRQELHDSHGECLIVRIDRIEPSKNIIRGFQAFEELLELYPEHHEKVCFLALLVPSRMDVDEYQTYLDDLMAAAGRINALYSRGQWEPVRVLVSENYPRAVAALQLYDVLLVNSIADGMNLVAKEGPIVNQRDGVLILSEQTGARQQLEPGALIISPCDVYGTAEAMHQALVMSHEDRRVRAIKLKEIIEREDIVDWLNKQIQAVKVLKL
jgi:trehalose 6-phosphate synthase